MKILYLLKKFSLEILREWKILIFSLIFGPLFVVLFYFAFTSTQTTYNIAINNEDIKVNSQNGVFIDAGQDLMKALESELNSDGTKKFKLIVEKDLENAKNKIKDKKYDVYMVIPKDFSKGIDNQRTNPLFNKTDLLIYGDMASSKYVVATISIGTYSNNLINSLAGKSPSVNFVEEFVISYKNKTEFDASIPAAILVGIIMLLFTTAISLVKEVDSGTIRRLQISKASHFQVLTAITISQILIGTTSVVVTLVTAFNIFGAKSEGSLMVILLISILACISIIPIGVIVASYSKSTSDVLIYANIPYCLLFIFSGTFPIPRKSIFSIAGHSIAVNDILPITPAMTALKRVMDEGMGLNDVMFEIILVIVLTVIYFMLGIFLFNRKHMKLS